MRNLRRASIQQQILTLATLLVVLVSVVAMFTEPFIYGRQDREFQNGLFAGRAETLFVLLKDAKTPQEEKAVRDTAASMGILVEKLLANELSTSQVVISSPDELVSRAKALTAGNILESISYLFLGEIVPNVLTVRVDTERVFTFSVPKFPAEVWFAPAVASGLLKIVVPLLVLAYFSSLLITNPLRRFAAAAKRVSLDDSTDEPFLADGASEIRSLAESLNVMRTRIQTMAEYRTRVLSSVGHDLRTPLTRLKMRAERSTEPELKQLMLSDITTLAFMVDECLAYFNDPSATEKARKVDLSSLLQTITSDFVDTGVDVTYIGPRKLVYVCKPQAMTRALNNLIENGSRYATRIELKLKNVVDGEIEIQVCDNGPGLSGDLKAKVLEPFFKADESRQIGIKGGLGLGLTIAQGIIIKGHGGRFELRDSVPNGLTIAIKLVPQQSDRL
ncbi:HAMP domain-containing histidine kinase [Rhizobium sp. VS19-DR104.2]|uniref:sensor histidine kinase n=1 Tax=unclassified Rhizobium TaxID=2613769 RepID=UPI001C5BD24D|nr:MULTISPECIES: HAMP domain-containing sensor histidine kinase [unclassified Rhizobium]MBZ5763260.1 HAMP domain-containing histidine kinase [Rhizobium sp. VS19-DR96]MBZ5769365.1 HAMP domain-containing histidine kinase [Rhizobium sp. VS19-DR129.2]MBZ5776929.1 HAMP domain-containing histidine kinase [Rhizobium sp. VS19-DRK62.2]MBZ5787869.1 HAMP domain-containing histidine kinase [Rhizobium sp. VS19-DR121]MBZ5805318.1 HAMP domain-containing histidine kinase [Rhizobium sp. VS19-DR181]